MAKVEQKLTKNNQRGFTLIELLLVLALLGVVLAISFEGFFVTYKSWQHSEAISPIINDVNNCLLKVSREIRNAEKPTQFTPAVYLPEADSNFSPGERLEIYNYDQVNNKWKRIGYRLAPDDKSLLQYGYVIADSAQEIEDRDALPIDNWTDLMHGISNLKVFEDITGSSTSDRRLIQVDLTLSDTACSDNPRFQVFNVSSAYLSRSQEVGSLSGSGISAGPDGETIILVNSVMLSNYQLQMDVGDTATLEAYIFPSNATNQNVRWTSSDANVVSIDSNGLTATITARKKGSAVIKVITECGGKEANCGVGVDSGGC